MPTDQNLRQTFNGAAADYDAIRPGYPELLFEDVLSFARFPAGGRALEIGCGTGQATLPFARRGCAILCLDIGQNLIDIATQKLREFPKVEFENSSFENWPLQPAAFDLVYSATAFHWIPPEIGYSKSAQVLKTGGTLAIFANRPPKPLPSFHEEARPIYAKYFPPGNLTDRFETIEAEIQYHTEAIQRTGLFDSITVKTYPWIVTYRTQDYLRLLNTYSDHLALDPEKRAALYQEIADLIDRRYGGQVERPYLTVLYLGKKTALPIS